MPRVTTAFAGDDVSIGHDGACEWACCFLEESCDGYGVHLYKHSKTFTLWDNIEKNDTHVFNQITENWYTVVPPISIKHELLFLCFVNATKNAKILWVRKPQCNQPLMTERPSYQQFPHPSSNNERLILPHCQQPILAGRACNAHIWCVHAAYTFPWHFYIQETPGLLISGACPLGPAIFGGLPLMIRHHHIALGWHYWIICAKFYATVILARIQPPHDWK